jgi:hypothetical protein
MNLPLWTREGGGWCCHDFRFAPASQSQTFRCLSSPQPTPTPSNSPNSRSTLSSLPSHRRWHRLGTPVEFDALDRLWENDAVIDAIERVQDDREAGQDSTAPELEVLDIIDREIRDDA